jgi:hypothetical protein
MSTAVAAAASVVLVCGGLTALAVHQHGAQRLQVRVVGTDPRILVATTTAGDAHFNALLESKVLYLPTEGCLVLSNDHQVPLSQTAPPSPTPSAAPTFLTTFGGVVWPYGSKPVKEGDRRGVEIPGVGTVWDGDTITAGGGAMMGDQIPIVAAALAPLLPTNCTRDMPGDFYNIKVIHRGPVPTSPPSEPPPARPLRWHLVRAADSTLDLDIDGNTCVAQPDVDVSENATSVTVRISAVTATDGCDGTGTTVQRTVNLLAPLGARALLGCDANEPSHRCATSGQR